MINKRSQLAQICGRVCLTSDRWTVCTNEGYISLTAHYVDVNWKLQSNFGICSYGTPTYWARISIEGVGNVR